MEVFVNIFFEKRLEQLLGMAERLDKAFSSAGLDYRVFGGLAVYLYVEEAEPDAGRLTKDIDIVVRREDLRKIAEAVAPFGLQYRQVGGLDMLVQAGAPSGRRAVHMIFSDAPDLGAYRTVGEVRLAPLSDLVCMKLTCYRLRDEMHLKDLDEAGLITPEIEAGLSAALRERLLRTRAR